MGQLIAGMDRCLANQALTHEQLQNQALQLGRQSLQLDEMTEGLVATSAALQDDVSGSMPAVDACAGPSKVLSKQVVGELERVWLQNLELTLLARIDTGAETSSLDARNIELFERDGRRWVRFEILHPDTDELVLVERKLKRMVAIIQSNTAEPERRPVIKLGVTIGSVSQTAEFTLTNRSHLGSQLLVGRNILQDVMVVDVSKKNIAPYVTPELPVSSGGAVP